MATNEELIKAAQVIKEFCSIGGNCGEMGCPFCDRSGNCCISSDRSVSTVYPADWELPKLRRWTDTDILWAKAAKASGASEITKDGKGFSSAICGSEKDVYSDLLTVMFPVNAFKSLGMDNSISIEDVLKEDSEND